MLNTIAIIADITGILSFVLSIILLIRSESLRKSIIYQKVDYNKKHTCTRLKLNAFNEALQENDPITPKRISDMRQELHLCLGSFKHVLSFKDKCIIKKVIKLLSNPKKTFDKVEICKSLDYLIARFSKKEDS